MTGSYIFDQSTNLFQHLDVDAELTLMLRDYLTSRRLVASIRHRLNMDKIRLSCPECACRD
jgi:hypothetical protein